MKKGRKSSHNPVILSKNPNLQLPNSNCKLLSISNLPFRVLAILFNYLLGPRFINSNSSSSNFSCSPLPLAYCSKQLNELVFACVSLWLSPTPPSLVKSQGSTLIWHPPKQQCPALNTPELAKRFKTWQIWTLDLSKFTRSEYLALFNRAQPSFRSMIAHIALPPYASTYDSFHPAPLLSLIMNTNRFPNLCAVTIPYWTLRALASWDHVQLQKLSKPIRLIVQGHPPSHCIQSLDALLDAWLMKMQPYVDQLIVTASKPMFNGRAHSFMAANKQQSYPIYLQNTLCQSPYLSWSKCQLCKVNYASPSPCNPCEPLLSPVPCSIKSYTVMPSGKSMNALDPNVSLSALDMKLTRDAYARMFPLNTLPDWCEHQAVHVHNDIPVTSYKARQHAVPGLNPKINSKSLPPAPWTKPCSALIPHHVCYPCLTLMEDCSAQQCIACNVVLCVDHMVLDRYECVHCGALVEQYICSACFADLPRHIMTCIDCGEALCDACVDEAYPCTSCDQLLCVECAEQMLGLPASSSISDITKEKKKVEGNDIVGPADHLAECAGRVLCFDCAALHKSSGQMCPTLHVSTTRIDEDVDESVWSEFSEDEHKSGCHHCQASDTMSPPPLSAIHLPKHGRPEQLGTPLSTALTNGANRKVPSVQPSGVSNGHVVSTAQNGLCSVKLPLLSTESTHNPPDNNNMVESGDEMDSSECTCAECITYKTKEKQAMAVLKAMVSASASELVTSKKQQPSRSVVTKLHKVSTGHMTKDLSSADAKMLFERLNLAMDELSAASARVAGAQTSPPPSPGSADEPSDDAWNALIQSLPVVASDSTSTVVAGPISGTCIEQLFTSPDKFGAVLGNLNLFSAPPPTPTAAAATGASSTSEFSIHQIPGEFLSMARQAMKDVLKEFVSSGPTSSSTPVESQLMSASITMSQKRQ